MRRSLLRWTLTPATRNDVAETAAGFVNLIHRQDLVAEVARVTAGAGVDMVIDNVGEATMSHLTDADGNPAHIYNSVSQVALGVDRMDLMTVEGSPWADPDLRTWTVADAVSFDFAWAG